MRLFPTIYQLQIDELCFVLFLIALLGIAAIIEHFAERN